MAASTDGAGSVPHTRRRARATLGTCGVAHFVHDGFSDVLFALLAMWAREFGLSFTQVGILKTAFSGTLAAFQVPAGLLAERWGERRVLALGTALTGSAFILMGMAGGFTALVLVLVLAGFGSGSQHPLSATLVSKAYAGGRRRAAIGTFNFTGDLGKVVVQPLIAMGAISCL